MKVRWSPDAADDLESIVDYIHGDNPSAARRVTETIYDRADSLAASPYKGRRGRVEGTRELVLAPLPFLIVYRVLDHTDAVEIVNIIHGARNWPPDRP
jgi:toxin ParE1/3/4